MNGCRRGALLGAVLLLGVVGCGGPEDTGVRARQSSPRVLLQGLSTDPDFVITKVTAPESAMPGGSFQTTVEVCNQGGAGSGVDVGLYFSDDDVITPADFWAEGLYVGYLAPGQCEKQDLGITVSVPMDGPWYFGAYADPYGSQFEGNEDNNGLAAPVMGIGSGPDFVVTAVTGPTSARNNASITTQVTVCNRGTQPGSTDVEVYLSADDFIYPNTSAGTSEDSAVGNGFISYLAPGQCTAVPVSGPINLPAPGTEGPYFVGAVVDPTGSQPELIEDNNAKAGYRMGVGDKPDFVVTAVTGPGGAQSGQYIRTQVTVCNRGTQAGSTELEVYLSADDVINPDATTSPPEDARVGMAYVDYLVPGQCRTVPVDGSVTVPPPGFEGPYFVGAVADPNNNQPELIEDNNATAGYRMGVGNRPDLVITSVTGPSSAQDGQFIQVQVTVCNRGTQSTSSDVRVYLSPDEILDPDAQPGPTADYQVGTAYTEYLGSGQCNTVPVEGTAYPPPPGFEGPYFVGAVVDPDDYQPELIEDNNTLIGYRMGLGHRADFVVTSVTGPASARLGDSFTAQVTVCNRGQQPDSAEVEVYLSADDVIRANPYPGQYEDTEAGWGYTEYLVPGQCATVPVMSHADTPWPGAPGAFFVGAVVDPDDNRQELIEDNNANAGYRMGVGNRPDFVVSAVTGPASARSGQDITTQVTVCNRGQDPGSTEVHVYLSEDDIIHGEQYPGPSEDAFFGSNYTDYLVPGQCATVPVSGTVWTPWPGEGAYFVGAVVDPYNNQQELIEDNNATAGYRMGVGNRPDWVVTSVTGPSSTQDGQSITAQVTVCNRGQQSGSADVEVYLSADDIIRTYMWPNPPEDSLVGVASTGPVYPNQCVTVPVSGNAFVPPPGRPGPYFVGAIVDPYDGERELIEDNNALAGYRMGVGYWSDFVITSVTGPASTQDGQPITTQVTVCNRGQQADSADVDVYLSADEVIRPHVPPYYPPEDYPVGSVNTGVVYPDQCVTVPVSGNAYAPMPGHPGAYFVGAVVDEQDYVRELIEDNNALVGYRMGVGDWSDLVITSVTGPASTRDGQPITTQVTVCNRGQQADSADVDVYLSADEVIRPHVPPYYPPEDYPVGSVNTGMVYPDQCVTVPVSGDAYAPMPGSPGAYFVGAVVDEQDYVRELIEDNNALAGYRIGVGSRADFVVTSVTGPFSALEGQTLSTQVTVCNRGQQSDSANVEVYLSADDVIRPYMPSFPDPSEDYPVGTAFTDMLNPGQCTTVPVSGNAYVPPPGGPGAYFVGAVVDPQNDAYELIEDNNTLAGYRIGVGSRADFVITTVTGPYSATPGNTFSVSVGICNRGQQSDTVDVDVYLSADANVNVPRPPGPPEDFYLGTVSSVSLAAGACTTRNLSATAPSLPEGPYYLGAVADPANSRLELIEDNNSKAGSILGLGTQADFVVTGVAGPNSAKPGNNFTANITVCNRGQVADSVDVDVYLSADATVSVPKSPAPPEDFYLGTVVDVSLAAGACASRPLVVTVPSVVEGAYYLGGVADPANLKPELIEDNNVKTGNILGVGTKADFLVTSVTGPSSVTQGASFSASFTVCNRGQQADVTDVDLYFSADTTIRAPNPSQPPEDFYLGTVYGVSLGVGACATRSLVVSGSAPSGSSYYLGAVADPTNSRPELIEDNNTKAGTSVLVKP